MISANDRFMLRPAFSGIADREERFYEGRVIELHEDHRYAVVDFGNGVRECFGLEVLEAAKRIRGKKR